MSFGLVVQNCERVVASAVNLGPDDTLVLWRRACQAPCPDASTDVYIEFKPGNCPVIIDADHNPLLIDVPGTYELRFQGATNETVRLCFDSIPNCG